ncbi:MAG: hypothetical protein CL595_06625 [Alteromonas sp.]|uniref:TcpQ domain-containing protein n=1 Tax=Alteromonas australica TaxID=589873 RepID=UPI000C5C115C|nr:TcpQ domain-containing protein [Alteromonas australica]MAB93597.1 hypothetical protein [Alteromonas sp.]MAO29923.1 hypothetical protein [Alteromonas sp.]|tara:strand:+ start:1641 stop:2258 length:618 start_codon:yes stop_codon:yes gene_type:complete
MAQKSYSSSMFWARQIALAVVLVIVAGVMIYVQQRKENAPLPEGETKDKTVSQGLSDFYREYRMSSTDPLKEEQGDFVLDIAGVDPQLDTKLARMSSEAKPVDEKWTGEHKFRTFKEGVTLREAISSYAQAEGMQLIWNLEQDFLIKYQFQLDNTVAGSLAKIASAIDSSFSGTVTAYICPEQRSLVVSARETPFLIENCQVVQG